MLNTNNTFMAVLIKRIKVKKLEIPINQRNEYCVVGGVTTVFRLQQY